MIRKAVGWNEPSREPDLPECVLVTFDRMLARSDFPANIDYDYQRPRRTEITSMVKILSFHSQTRTQNLDVEKLNDIEYFAADPISAAWPTRLRIKQLSVKKPQDYFPVGPLRLMSSRFVEVCREFDVNAEFLPVQLLEKGGSKSPQKFYFCHLLDHVACFDFKNSKLTYRNKKTKWIDEVKQLAILDKKAAGHHLFRVDCSLFLVAASDEFAEEVQRRKLSGAVFMEPKEWRGVSS